jgi:2-(1,2-epoxy-1,2-dihydrophenyl)acetyl-CoA isomerase
VSDILVERGADGVLSIELNRPEKLNSISDAMWAQLGRELGRVHADPGIRAVLLRGAGGVFSAGSDVSGFIGQAEPLGERIEACNEVLITLHELPVPTVAQVDGLAGGSGANLALLCDFVLASDRSRFAELFTHIGLSLDTGSSWLLPRLVGERRAREIALLGEWMDAATAQRIGLISTVVPGELLQAECEALLGRLIELSRPASAGTKRLLNESWQRSLRDALTAETVNQLWVIDTPEARAAIEAFTAKSQRKARS